MRDMFRHMLYAAAGMAMLVTAAARADDAVLASGNQTNGKAHVDILSLKRTEGDTLTIRFVVVNDGNRTMTLYLPNLRLIDLINRRSYGTGVTSTNCAVEPGARTNCWAVFAAPPANVKSINVTFHEDFGLISVPIEN